MPRKPRFFLPGVPVHIVQRGHSREPVFFADGDYSAYLNWLAEGAERYRCAIHAYVLMTNHVHILATPKTQDGITRMMQYTGRRYVPYVNHTYGTSGSLWERTKRGQSPFCSRPYQPMGSGVAGREAELFTLDPNQTGLPGSRGGGRYPVNLDLSDVNVASNAPADVEREALNAKAEDKAAAAAEGALKGSDPLNSALNSASSTESPLVSVGFGQGPIIPSGNSGETSKGLLNQVVDAINPISIASADENGIEKIDVLISDHLGAAASAVNKLDLQYRSDRAVLATYAVRMGYFINAIDQPYFVTANKEEKLVAQLDTARYLLESESDAKDLQRKMVTALDEARYEKFWPQLYDYTKGSIVSTYLISAPLGFIGGAAQMSGDAIGVAVEAVDASNTSSGIVGLGDMARRVADDSSPEALKRFVYRGVDYYSRYYSDPER